MLGVRTFSYRLWASYVVLVVKNPPASSGVIRDRVGSLGWEDPLEMAGRKWQPIPVFLPRKFHGQRSLVGYSPWGLRELDVIEHTCRLEGDVVQTIKPFQL